MKVSDRYDTYLRRYERVKPKNVIFRENLTFDLTHLTRSNIDLGQKKYVQSRDLVEAHRLVFSAKLYDNQGPIARGLYQPPPPWRRYENALTGRGLTYIPFFCSSTICCVGFFNSLHKRIFDEFWNIYLFHTKIAGGDVTKSAISQNCVARIGFCFAPNDVELMSGEACQVSCRYRLGFRSYFGKTEGGGGKWPPGG